MTSPFSLYGLLASRTACARVPRVCVVAKWLQSRDWQRRLQTELVPRGKLLKDEAKRRKAEAKAQAGRAGSRDARLDKWELTVGVEIHAELNTAEKLFSSASAASGGSNDQANTRVALFDAAMPGSQPRFSRATLLPALRAAIALGCTVQRRSGWDRKHYFHWDQPNGYQITQYYQPFARDGVITLGADDGVPALDLNGATTIDIGIKQIQMEQDTAKTTHHPPSTYHVDLNRSGVPLIEIITLPQIRSPETAAAVVRKIQSILKSVDSCATGMELGGLRADVNVSVRQRGSSGVSSYAGIGGLGQRTEIKNLSSFAAVENAIVAERDRQISVLEAGGVIEGETRGWTLGATETTRLRGKEGEVDYRYMPDADLLPLIIGPDLVEHLRNTLPELPDETISRVQRIYGLTGKDARAIVALNDGERLEFLEQTVELMLSRRPNSSGDVAELGKIAGNWVLHELGGLLTLLDTEWNAMTITPSELADLLVNLQRKQISSRAAKQLLVILWPLTREEKPPSVDALIDEKGLRLKPLSKAQYVALAEQIMAENPEMVAAVREKGQKGKMMWFVGQMARKGEDGTVDPVEAREVIEGLFRS